METTREFAKNLVKDLEDLENVLNTFRNSSNTAFIKMINMTQLALNEKLDADTQVLIKRDAEYEIMYRFLQSEQLLERYGTFRSDIYKEVKKLENEHPA